MQLMSPTIEAGTRAGQANALYGALLRVVRRCMELAAWTEVANSDVVLCVPVSWAVAPSLMYGQGVSGSPGPWV